MKLESAITALAIPILLAGCAGANVGLRAGESTTMRGSAPPPGSSYGSAAIRAEVSPNVYIGVLFLSSIMYGTRNEYQRWRSGAYWREPPEMAEGRAIAERDCSKPLGPLYENLRCK